MADNELVSSNEEINEDTVKNEINETFNVESDYWDLKRFLELKGCMERIFKNPKRAKALREFIQIKNKQKDDIKKISEDENYAKALGIGA